MIQKPSIKQTGIKHVAHLANRAAKAMREAGCSYRLIDDMRVRVLDDANKWSIEEAIGIVAEYCEVESPEGPTP
jgi:hypothetical protein